jgi:hypothetical protein
VEVIAVTPEEPEVAMLAKGATAWEATHLREMLIQFGAGESAYVTDDVHTLTGHRPRSVSDFPDGPSRRLHTRLTSLNHPKDEPFHAYRQSSRPAEIPRRWFRR